MCTSFATHLHTSGREHSAVRQSKASARLSLRCEYKNNHCDSLTIRDKCSDKMLASTFASCVLYLSLHLAYAPVLAAAYSPILYLEGTTSEKITPKVFIIDMVSNHSNHTAFLSGGRLVR